MYPLNSMLAKETMGTNGIYIYTWDKQHGIYICNINGLQITDEC